jgi:predicted dehydrogenase
MEQRCLVVGAGTIGRAHAQVVQFFWPGRCAVFGKTERKDELVRQMGIPFFCGSLAEAVKAFGPTHGIVATPVDTLGAVTRELLSLGIPDLLVEKPGALGSESARAVARVANELHTEIFVGFNRRGYASVLLALEEIRRTGDSISSVTVDFSEPASAGDTGPKFDSIIQERWALAQSIHAIDLAFLPAGLPDPARSSFYRASSLSWHPSGAAFVGSGFTEKGIPFSYSADWRGPGRWAVQWVTRSCRYLFQPLETLKVQRDGVTDAKELPLCSEWDLRFKPGYYWQCREFLSGNPSKGLMGYADSIRLGAIVEKIAGYC